MVVEVAPVRGILEQLHCILQVQRGVGFNWPKGGCPVKAGAPCLQVLLGQGGVAQALLHHFEQVRQGTEEGRRDVLKKDSNGQLQT